MRHKILTLLCVLTCSHSLFAGIVELQTPTFSLPQTTVNVGYTHYQFHIQNKNVNHKWKHKATNPTTYGFDLEIPYYDFWNIGVYYRFDYYREPLPPNPSIEDINLRIANYLGLFSRFQYMPLNNSSLNLFARVDAGVGPVLMKFSGISLQGALHFGVETYFTDWFGVSLSYGFVEEWGRETLIAGASDADPKGTLNNLTIRSSGQSLMLGVKTTFF